MTESATVPLTQYFSNKSTATGSVEETFEKVTLQLLFLLNKHSNHQFFFEAIIIYLIYRCMQSVLENSYRALDRIDRFECFRKTIKAP